MKKAILLTTFAVLLFSTAAPAEQGKTDIGNATLHITSDTMVSDQTASYIEFSGNVVATREDAVINADTIKIFLYKENQKKNDQEQSVEKIEASGNVEYVSGNRRALSDKAIYTTRNQILVLTGTAPKVFTGDSFVTGKTITLYRENDRVVVEGGKEQRVEALFNPKDTKPSKGN